MYRLKDEDQVEKRKRENNTKKCIKNNFKGEKKEGKKEGKIPKTAKKRNIEI